MQNKSIDEVTVNNHGKYELTDYELKINIHRSSLPAPIISKGFNKSDFEHIIRKEYRWELEVKLPVGLYLFTELFDADNNIINITTDNVDTEITDAKIKETQHIDGEYYKISGTAEGIKETEKL